MTPTTTPRRAPRRRKPRQLSHAFTAPKGAKRIAFTIDKVPPALYAVVMRRAARDGVSVRSVVLSFLSDWAVR